MKFTTVQVEPPVHQEFREIAQSRQTKVFHVGRILVEAWKLIGPDVRDEAQKKAMESASRKPRRRSSAS